LTTPSIVIVGSNHECASVDLRERLAFTGETLKDGLHALRERVDEGLIVSTCNRTELYVVADDPEAGRDEIFDFLTRYHRMPAHVLSEMSYVHADSAAVRHLFRVASGLDSIVLGEPQILAQIRDALDAARDAGTPDMELSRLIHRFSPRCWVRIPPLIPRLTQAIWLHGRRARRRLVEKSQEEPRCAAYMLGRTRPATSPKPATYA